VTITSQKSVTLRTNDLFGVSSQIKSEVGLGATGKGGDVNVNASSISLGDGARIESSTFGKGDAGNVTLTAQQSISLAGNSIDGFSSRVSSLVSKGADGKGGNINTSAGSVSLENGGQFTSSTLGKGDAGRINIIADGVFTISGKTNNRDITNPFSGVFASSQSSTGVAGDIFVTSPKLTLANGGKINAESLSGNGGNIQIGGKLPAEFSSIQGSQIKPVETKLLLLRRGAQISTNASGTPQQGGNGGNININSDLIVAIPQENSDISANAVKGRGGNVNINSQGLFGIGFRKQLTNNSDITASSDFGQTGNVNITTPGTDPGKDSNQLPNVPNDASNQISQVCSANIRDNKLTVTGRGGLPPNANDTLNVDVVWQDARAPQSQPTASSATTTNPFKLAPPAVGWVFDGKGKVTLIAASTQGQPTGTSVACPNQK
jgi:large exoprotein involved in heme utilization and adhesion